MTGHNSYLIDMRGIARIYDTGKVKVEALKGVDVKIRENEFVSIVGPSGSGKSTLMNIIGCLDTPNGGTYYLDGKRVDNFSRTALAEVRNKKIGFIFQNFNLLSYATAAENVEIPLVFAGIPARKRRVRVEELLESVGLAHRAHHKPAELSGGEMQRVAIARALANNPRIILADEPTGNLDSAAGNDIIATFQSLWERGRTLVVITHDRQVARRTERVIKLRDGHIEGDGTPAEMLSNSTVP